MRKKGPEMGVGRGSTLGKEVLRAGGRRERRTRGSGLMATPFSQGPSATRQPLPSLSLLPFFFFLTAFLCISYSAQKLLTPVQKSVIQV